MIAKAKSIAHGINALNYITGVSANKKHPEKIFHICDSFLPPGIDPLGIWNSIKIDSLSRPRMKNNLIRIEISPAAEHTRDFTPDDWKQLWQDFVAEFDRQEMKGKGGRVISHKTNLAGSKSTVWLHLESDSGTPHLHAIVSRLDENGNIGPPRGLPASGAGRQRQIFTTQTDRPSAGTVSMSSPEWGNGHLKITFPDFKRKDMMSKSGRMKKAYSVDMC